MLKEIDYYAGTIDKKYNTGLQEAIVSYEMDNNILIPHTRNSLGDLFILLYFKVDREKMEKLFKQNNKFI